MVGEGLRRVETLHRRHHYRVDVDEPHPDPRVELLCPQVGVEDHSGQLLKGESSLAGRRGLTRLVSAVSSVSLFLSSSPSSAVRTPGAPARSITDITRSVPVSMAYMSPVINLKGRGYLGEVGDRVLGISHDGCRIFFTGEEIYGPAGLKNYQRF